MDASISAVDLQSAIADNNPPLIIDVRRRPVFRAGGDMIAGALWRDPERVEAWAGELPRARRVVVYCVHGHEVSRSVTAKLAERGIHAQYLSGGIEQGWRPAAGALSGKPKEANTRWVTRERPKIDRIACPWLIARFIDAEAEFLYVPSAQVLTVAQQRQAIPYDIPDVEFSHSGEHCSFDAFVERFHLGEPAFEQLATIVRGADTARLELAPQAPGLVAVSLGLSRIFADDHEMLQHGMVMYDALYAWCRHGQDETHTWNPATYRTAEPARIGARGERNV